MTTDTSETSRLRRDLFAFYGHHKCATMTLNAIIGGICKRLGLRFEAVFDETRFSGDLNQYVRERQIEFLSYGNADIEFVRQLPRHKGFHIIRDPRDIVVSAYFSHLHSHSTSQWRELENHRTRLKSMSLQDGLAAEIKFRGRSFDHMARWNYDQPDILEIRFEDFIRSNYDSMIRIISFLGLLDSDAHQFQYRLAGLYRDFAALLGRKLDWRQPARLGPDKLYVPELLTITWRNSFHFKSQGRAEGEVDERSHYRKGKSGDWSEYFDDTHKELFKTLYPGLVPQLHYHPDDNW